MLKIYFGQSRTILLCLKNGLCCTLTPVQPVAQSFLISHRTWILTHLLEVFDGSLLDLDVHVASFLMAEGILFWMKHKRLYIV